MASSGFFNPKFGTPAWYKASPAVQRSMYFAARTKRMLPGLRKKRRLFIRPELKYVETQVLSNAPPIGAGTIAIVNSVAEGADFNNRIGRLIVGKYLQVDIGVFPPTNGSWDEGTAWIVYDKQPNGAVPAVSDVLDETTLNVYQSFKNVKTNADRFSIVRQLKLGPVDHTAAYVNARHRIYVPCAKHGKSRFLSAAAAVPETGAWYIILMSRIHTGDPVSSISLDVAVRFCFYDA